MTSYLLLKLIHIFAAVVVTGTGAGIAFFMLMASRSKNPQAIAVTTKHVILADWIFTLPAVLVQLATGFLLMQQLGYSFQSAWFLAVLGLFAFVGLCWLPVIRIQYQLFSEAKKMLATNLISARFKQLMRRWTALGVFAFSAIILIYILMVFKPLSVS